MKKEKFPKTCTRFVAYFDVMGFEDYIYRHDHAAVEKRIDSLSLFVRWARQSKAFNTYKKTISARGNEMQRLEKSTVLPVCFSDTILAISNDGTLEDFKNILKYSSLFFYNALITDGIPIKGAIAYGTFTADDKNQIFVGRPLVDAYKLAEEVYFYGVVLHHTAQERFSEFLKIEDREALSYAVSAKNFYINEGKIPIKGGSSVMHSYIKLKGHSVIPSVQETLIRKQAMEKFYESASGSIRRYVDNTIDVYFDPNRVKK